MIAERPAVVTFDCYSALIDSHTGLTRAFADLASRGGWTTDPAELAAHWDRRNKRLQGDAETPATFRELSREAMASTLEDYGLDGEAEAATEAVLDTMPNWPHWPDVPEGVGAVAERYPVALLTNIDNDLLARTWPGYEFTQAVTSEDARCFKPRPGIYRYAEATLGVPLLHVPASARDVRGALEAGLAVVRVVRPGHGVDPDGPAPPVTVHDLRELAALLP